MSTFSGLRYPTIIEFFYFLFILPNIIAIPLPSNKTLYDVSVQSLLDNKCKMPKEIHLPFSKTSDPSTVTFDYLKVPLKECQMAEAMDKNKESNLLCKEIFEVLKNITCSKYNNSLPEIKSTRLSNDVCNEFKAMEGILPKQNNYLAGRLVDELICKFLCQDKFETLCQTLLWSYDVQDQIKNAVKAKESDATGVHAKTTQLRKDNLETKVTEDEHEKDVKTKPNKDIALETQKISQEPVLDNANDPNNGEQLTTEDQTVNRDVNEQTINLKLNANLLESVSPSANSFINPTPSSQLEIVDVSKNFANNDENAKVINPVPNGNLPVTEVADSNIQGTSDQLNDLQDDGKSEPNKNVGSIDVVDNKVTIEKKEPVSNILHDNNNAGKISKNSTVEISTQDIHDKEVISSTLQNQDKNKANDNNIETIANPEIPAISNIPSENELNNVDLQGEENESKVQEKSDSETPAADNINKLTNTPKETDSAVPNKSASDIESSTIQISPDINANADQDEEQDDKDVEQYYKNALNEISKVKKPEIKSSVVSEVANPNEFPINYDAFINQNNIGRGRDEMQIIPTFPEQEDSHFFFYFLSIVLILMAGYLIFHNKQKIIALIVEGRHERRRRSHGAGYKKLETK